MDETAASSSQRKRKGKRGRRNEKRALAKALSSLSLSSLPNDVVEEVFLRLPVKTLIRFKSLSKQWGSRIESHSFREKHLKIAERSHVNHPSIMVFTNPCSGTRIDFKTVCSEGSPLSFTPLIFPQRFALLIDYTNACNGLFCIQSSVCNYVVNPATRWLRPLPLARFQILHPNGTAGLKFIPPAFVKSVDYKLVWLYNCDAFIPNDAVTKCEIFDFRANAWRYLSCTPGYRITSPPEPSNGSVYWMREPYNSEVKVIALDIHTENFRLLPPKKIRASSSSYINICTLDNRLCISKTSDSYMHDTKIWRLKSSEDMWEEIYSIDLLSTPLTWISDALYWKPVAICKNKKILLSHYVSGTLVVYNPQTKSVRLSCSHPNSFYSLYFESLISHI